MSEPNEDPKPNDPENPAPKDDGDEELRAPGLKALHAERAAREQAEKDRAALQKQLDDIAAKDLTELQQAQKVADDAAKAAADADARAAKADAEALRWRIAAKHGISDEDAELFLTGSDEDILTRQAERLAQREPTPGKGTHVPGAGKQPGNPPSLDAQIAAAQAEGDVAKVMSLKAQQLSELAKQ